MKLFKLVPQLASCSNYFAAKELLRDNKVFNEIELTVDLLIYVSEGSMFIKSD